MILTVLPPRPKRWLLAVSVSVLVATAAIGALVAQLTGLPRGAALRVGDTVVTTATLAQRVHLLEAMYGAHAPAGDAAADQFRRASAKTIAMSIVLDQAAARRGIVISDAQARKELSGLVEAHGGGDAFVQLLGTVGASEQDVLEEIKRRQRSDILVEQVIDTVPAITDADVRRFYDEHQTQIFWPEHRHLRNIVAASKDQAEEVLARVRAGEDFAALAKDYSLDAATRDNAGELGGLTRGELSKSYADQAFSAAPGAVFGPVQSQTGWNVGQVLQIAPARSLSFPEAREELRTGLQQQRVQNAWHRWLSARIQDADIDYAEQYRPAEPAAPPPVALPPGSPAQAGRR